MYTSTLEETDCIMLFCMRNERKWSFILLAHLLVLFSLFLVFFFKFFDIASFVSTTLKKITFKAKYVCLESSTFWLRPIWNSNSVQFKSSEVIGDIFCSWDVKTSSITGTFPPKFPENATKRWYKKLLDKIIEKCLWNYLFATDWFLCRFWWSDSAHSPFPATTTQMFPQSLSSHTLCSCLEIISATNNLCNVWHSKLQQTIARNFEAANIFAQK